MFGFFDKYIAVFLTGLVVTYLLTPLVRSLAVRFGVVDMPNERRPHKRPTARGGGLALVIGVHAACLVALLFPWPKFTGDLDFSWWRNFALSSLVLIVVGVIDDVRGLRPLIKLGGQALAAALVFLSGARFGAMFGYQLPWFLDFIMVEIWLLGVINAFNLIDGLDGLAAGLAIISAAGLAGIFALNHMPSNVLILLGLVGACLGFLRYNFNPATIFLGDTGSMFLGFTLGVVSLQTFSKNTFVLSLAIPMMVLGVPIYDTLLAIWRRSVRGILRREQYPKGQKRLGIMQPDVDHLHHRLLKAGLSTRRVATTLFITNAMLVVFGLLLTTFRSHTAGIFLIALLAGAYVLMRHMAVIELRETGGVLLTGLRRPTHAMLKSLSYPAWDMVCLAGALATAMALCDPPVSNFWHSWFLELPIWVTPTISLLALSRTYLIVWTRARLLDVLMLVGTLQAGLLISLGLTLLIDPTATSTAWVRMLLIVPLGHLSMILPRVFYRSVEEVVHYLKLKGTNDGQNERILLYGAGGRCQLFLKERGFNNSTSFDNRIIVGLMDDEPSLHFQWVYGHLVLGGLKDLPGLIQRHKISGIVITTTLRPESLSALREVTTEHGLFLGEWLFEVRNISDVPTYVPEMI
jgi:UDP-N-acetylmuramyl pentapeptide phosphotransferase/UDP-N-acetylglucosamine-1-phosphate transferase